VFDGAGIRDSVSYELGHYNPAYVGTLALRRR
jgi:hypothetical protein